MTRDTLYEQVGAAVGKEFHIADIRSIDEARTVYRIVRNIASAHKKTA